MYICSLGEYKLLSVISSRKAITKMQGIIIAIVIVVAVASGIAYYYLTLPKLPEEIRIGVVVPLTGPAALVGQDHKWAADMAAEEINAAGGVLGRKVRIIYGDDESKPEKGASETERLITKEGVVALAGHYHSSVHMAAIEISHKYMIPDIGVSAMTEALRLKQYSNAFFTHSNTTAMAGVYARFTIDYVKPKTYALLSEETDFGRLISKAIIKYITEHSTAKCVYEGYAKVGEKDYYPMLTEIKAKKPDVILINTSGVGVPLAYKQARELGIPATMIGYLYVLKDFIDMVGPEYSEYYFSSNIFARAPVTPKTLPWFEKYTAKYGKEPSVQAARQYDAIYVVCDAIQRAGSVEADKIIKALRETKFVGVRGTITFDPVYQEWGFEYVEFGLVGQIQGGKLVVVYPFGVAEKPAIWQPWAPKPS